MPNPNEGKIEFAFQCVNCNSFEGPDQAGELEVPTACHICGYGVKFDEQTGARILVPENWIVLADLTEKQQTKLASDYGFGDTHRIVSHTPALSSADREPMSIDRSAEESLGGEDQA